MCESVNPQFPVLDFRWLPNCLKLDPLFVLVTITKYILLYGLRTIRLQFHSLLADSFKPYKFMKG
jgi:hypothetical protein